MEVLLSIAVALLAGLLMSRVVKPLKLPAVTGYLVAGLLIGLPLSVNIAMAVIAVFANITAIQRLLHMKKNLD